VIDCLRCGLCCFNNGKACKFLKFFKTVNKSYCSVYKSRLGRFTGIINEDGEKVFCGLRSGDSRIFKGCPYNKIGGKKE